MLPVRPSRRLRPIRSRLWAALGWSSVWLGAVLLGNASWIRRTFGPISVDQLLLHLPGAGAETTGAEHGYIADFLVQAILVPSATVFASWVVLDLIGARLRAVGGRSGRPSPAREPSGSPNPPDADPVRRRGVGRRVVPAVAAAGIALAGIGSFAQTVGLAQYVASVLTTVSMDDYYVVPNAGDIDEALARHGDERPLNLVTVYLESGEQSLGDDGLFELDMIEPLETATRDWARLENLSVYEGGGWTMAGIVGTECGIPLRGPGRGIDDLDSNAIGAARDDYLPGAVCLGDVLSDAGYRSVFMGGADAGFAAKERFLRSHGYDEVLDLATWHAAGEVETSDWGLSDARLFAHATDQVSRLHASGQPFQLTVLTLDLHEPAYLFESCPRITADVMVSVARCSFGHVAGFVDYLRDQGYLDDTVVVIVADHPKMLGEGSSFHDELSGLDERPLFNRFWSPDGVRLARTSADQLSLYATTLDLLGFGRADRRAGVGVSLLAETPGAGTPLDLSDADYATLVHSRSTDLYRRLWGLAPDGSVLGSETENE